jgi:hypothetical protein
LAWVVDPKTQTVRVHTAPEEWVIKRIGDVLAGGAVLSGFQLPVQDIFNVDNE